MKKIDGDRGQIGPIPFQNMYLSHPHLTRGGSNSLPLPPFSLLSLILKKKQKNFTHIGGRKITETGWGERGTMDRLIYNPNPIPSKIHLNPRHHLPRLAEIAVARLGIPPSSPAEPLRVAASLLRKAEISSFSSPPLASTTVKFYKLCPIRASSLSSSSPLDSPDGSNPKPPKIVERASERGKV